MLLEGIDIPALIGGVIGCVVAFFAAYGVVNK